MCRDQRWEEAVDFARTEVRPLIERVLGKSTAFGKSQQISQDTLWAERAWEITTQAMALLTDHNHEVCFASFLPCFMLKIHTEKAC